MTFVCWALSILKSSNTTAKLPSARCSRATVPMASASTRWNAPMATVVGPDAAGLEPTLGTVAGRRPAVRPARRSAGRARPSSQLPQGTFLTGRRLGPHDRDGWLQGDGPFVRSTVGPVHNEAGETPFPTREGARWGCPTVPPAV